MRRRVLFLLLFLLSVGCNGPAEDATDSKQARLGTQVVKRERSHANMDSHLIAGDRVGRLAFIPIKNWPMKPAKVGAGIVMFAPQNSEWESLGLRPNLAIRIDDNPSMGIDDAESELRRALSQNVEELNSHFETSRVLNAEGESVEFQDLTFDLRQSTLTDGTPCLASECDGVFRVIETTLKTRTFSITLLDADHIYSATMTIPASHDDLLRGNWESFVKTVRYIENEAP
jgi:hypothetical protein